MKRIVLLIILNSVLVTNGFTQKKMWTEFNPTGDFSVNMPGQPQHKTQDTYSNVGTLRLNIYSYQPSDSKKDNLVYMIMYSDYPEGSVTSDNKESLPVFFRNAVDGAVRNVNGVLLSEKDIEIQGYPGKEIQIGYQGGVIIINMRQYLVKNRTYILQVMTPKEKQDNEFTTKFFESFKLIE